VIDAASTDGTIELLKSAPDIVTRWVSEPDHGIYHALNKGLGFATGDYYLVLGADDTLLPDALERYALAAAVSNADIVTAPVWNQGKLLRPRKTLSSWRSEPPLVSAHSVGALIRRALHKEVGPYSRKLPIAADTMFLLQVHRAGKRVIGLDAPVGQFGSAGVSSTDVLGSLSESLRAHVAVRGHWPWFFTLFVLRVLKNWRRIAGATPK
jgi:glycosyltransferase involved in cell wall biosynthesis